MSLILPSHDLPLCDCPECGSAMGAHIGRGGRIAQPATGDFSICPTCGELLRVRDSGKLSKVTSQEIALLSDDEIVLIAQLQRARNTSFPVAPMPMRETKN